MSSELDEEVYLMPGPEELVRRLQLGEPISRVRVCVNHPLKPGMEIADFRDGTPARKVTDARIMAEAYRAALVTIRALTDSEPENHFDRALSRAHLQAALGRSLKGTIEDKRLDDLLHLPWCDATDRKWPHKRNAQGVCVFSCESPPP